MSLNRCLLWLSIAASIFCIVRFYLTGMGKNRPMLTGYIILFLITRFVPSHPNQESWHGVWVGLTAALLPGRVEVTVECVRELVKDLGDPWERRWLLLGVYSLSIASILALILSSTVPMFVSLFVSLVALTQYLSIGLFLLLLIVAVYVILSPVETDPMPAVSTLIHTSILLCLLLTYVVTNSFTPGSGLAAPFIVIDRKLWTVIHQSGTLTVILCLAIWALTTQPKSVSARPGPGRVS